MPGSRTQDTRPAVFHQVSAGYTRAMGIPLAAGRALEASDVDRRQMTALVNKALVTRYFGDENPLGKTVRVPRLRQPPANLESDTFEIVGVVGDTVTRDHHRAHAPRAVRAAIR